MGKNLAGWMMFCGAIAIGVADGVYRAVSRPFFHTTTWEKLGENKWLGGAVHVHLHVCVQEAFTKPGHSLPRPFHAPDSD
jgi:hypothetical protein